MSHPMLCIQELLVIFPTHMMHTWSVLLQFSNHTGYPVVHGKVFDGSHLTELTEGLTKNELIQHSHLLTGE